MPAVASYICGMHETITFNIAWLNLLKWIKLTLVSLSCSFFHSKPYDSVSFSKDNVIHYFALLTILDNNFWHAVSYKTSHQSYGIILLNDCIRIKPSQTIRVYQWSLYPSCTNLFNTARFAISTSLIKPVRANPCSPSKLFHWSHHAIINFHLIPCKLNWKFSYIIRKLSNCLR